eukprot:m.120748 g.120748  ORF g.120748 m.120748 type:complete len:158 (+) comp15505_c0_seq1:1402-1875(+)
MCNSCCPLCHYYQHDMVAVRGFVYVSVKSSHQRLCSGVYMLRYQLDFVQSEFRGLLPKHYERTNGTRAIPTHMNALNKEEPSRYVDINDCDLLVDFESVATTALEPNYRTTHGWKQKVCIPFLDSAATTNMLARALYLPFQPSTGAVFRPYCLYTRP